MSLTPPTDNCVWCASPMFTVPAEHRCKVCGDAVCQECDDTPAAAGQYLCEECRATPGRTEDYGLSPADAIALDDHDAACERLEEFYDGAGLLLGVRTVRP